MFFLATRNTEALNPAVQNQFDLAIDTDVTGNSGSGLGSLDPCVAVGVNDTFEVDLVVQGVPEPGIAGLAADIMYDPSVLRIESKQYAGLMLDHIYLTFSDQPPDSDGDFRIDDVNLDAIHETGDGAILRLTFRALTEGGSTLTWDDINPFGLPPHGTDWDGIPDVYYVDLEAEPEPDYIGIFPNMRARGAEVVVGGTCPGNLLDGDGDGYGDMMEDHVETLVLKSCADTPAINDEPMDAWPPDFDNNQSVNISDVLALKPVFGAAGAETERYDLAPSGSINISDVMAIKPQFGASCTP